MDPSSQNNIIQFVHFDDSLQVDDPKLPARLHTIHQPVQIFDQDQAEEKIEEAKAVLQSQPKVKRVSLTAGHQSSSVTRFSQYMQQLGEDAVMQELQGKFMQHRLRNQDLNRTLGGERQQKSSDMASRLNFFGNKSELKRVESLGQILEPYKVIERTRSSAGRMRKGGGNRKGVEEFWNVKSFKNEMLKKNLADDSKSVQVSKEGSKSAREISNFVETGQVQQEIIKIVRELKDYRNPLQPRDIVQETALHELIKDFNAECTNYSSPFIHLGVLLKKAMSLSETKYPAPSLFLTQASSLILDNLSFMTPQLQHLLIPLKHCIFSSLFYAYPANHLLKQETAQQKLEMQHINNIANASKYFTYETYHEMYQEAIKKNKILKGQLEESKRNQSD